MASNNNLHLIVFSYSNLPPLSLTYLYFPFVTVSSIPEIVNRALEKIPRKHRQKSVLKVKDWQEINLFNIIPHIATMPPPHTQVMCALLPPPTPHIRMSVISIFLIKKPEKDKHSNSKHPLMAYSDGEHRLVSCTQGNKFTPNICEGWNLDRVASPADRKGCFIYRNANGSLTVFNLC
jgi:hypothetical protein